MIGQGTRRVSSAAHKRRVASKHLLSGRLSTAVALSLMASPVSAADGGIWQACTIDAVQVCAPAGCASERPAISIFLSSYADGASERSAYYRCALQITNCQRYRADIHRRQDVTIFSVPDRSVFAKLGSDNRITDVAAVGDRVIISRGRCARRAPPPESSLKPR